MGVSPLQLDVGLTGPALPAVFPPICAQGHRQRLVPDAGGLDELSHLAKDAWYERSRIFFGQGGRPPEEQQGVLWQTCFSDFTQWRDYNRSKPTLQRPDFRQKGSKVDLWLDKWTKPAWADSQLASRDARLKEPPDSVLTSQGQEASAAHEGHLQVLRCRKLCEEGNTIDAVDALSLLVKRGCHVPKSLFYRVLKRCTSRKYLLVGRRVHALTIGSGYEGDPFLATHLIGLYASHGRLEEAMRVFSKVTTPDAYNWASIIFACARHGEAVRAIRLYRKMRESIVQPDNRIYSAVLNACATAQDLVAGQEVHAHILESPGEPDIFVQNGLLDMYAKCRSLEDARKVFDRLPKKDVVTWNAMIAGYAQQGMGQEALTVYNSMQQEGLSRPDSVTFICLLQACATVGDGAMHNGKQLHAQIDERGLIDEVLGCSLVSMYAKCGSLEDARSVFDSLSNRNAVTWTALIAGYVQKGMGQEALSLYRSMQLEGLSPPNPVTFICLLQACASVGVGALYEGKQLHARIEQQGLQDDVAVGGSLVNMYAKCGSLEDARHVFDRLLNRDVVTWTAIIGAYAQQGMGQEALRLYNTMQQEGLSLPDPVTFKCLLQACACVGVAALAQGKQLHAQIEEQGLQNSLVLGGMLVNMYANCGCVEDAQKVFDRFPHKDAVTWNALIGGYTRQGMGQEALTVFRSMQQEGLSCPDAVTFVRLLHACASVGAGALHEGKKLHALIEGRGLQDDVVLGGSLVNMYAKCGCIVDARTVFDRLPARNCVTWTAMIAGYAQQGMGQEALNLYIGMQHEGISRPDSVTFICLLQACATVGVAALDQGKQIHAQIEERGLQDDVVLGGSLVNMYAKCGSLADAQGMFDRLPKRDLITWTAMIAGYAQQGMGQEALSLYHTMQQEALCPPDCCTFACLLQACAVVAALPLGKLLHAQIEERGIQVDVVVGAALVNMYAKCGSMSDSQLVFDSLPERTIAAWGALIGGYTHQGDSEVVFDLLHRMRLEGVQPDEITLLNVLTVCSHVGLVDKGRNYFEAMRADYGICPTVEHYTCMIDLLGRAGHLDEALEMAKTIPFPANGAVWHTLLGACRKWDNVEIGKQAFEFAVGADAKDDASYMLMSNIYASTQMGEAVKEMQARRVKSGVWKTPGQSWWTDMHGVVHTFGVGGKNYSESEGIYTRQSSQ